MAKANAGRILIMPRGTYDANATYEFLDLVTYNNASWLAKKTATGIEPADGEYWHKMADGVELVTNLTTEAEGKALDASMGKVLKDLIDAVGADALRERLDALEADNVVQSDDIEALKLAVEALGNIDNATVRYVSDEADENFGWVQTKDVNGNWVNWKYGVGTATYLILKGAMSDICSFTKYGDAGQTITKGDKGIVFTKPNNSTHGYFDTDALYDMSKYSKLVFVVSEFNSVTGAYVALMGSIGATSPLYSQKLIDRVGTYEVDLTSINAKCCVMVCLPSGSVAISDMYLE